MNPSDYIGKEFQTSIGVLKIETLLGRGKSGYSYLAIGDPGYVILKEMHYEPCDYYSFGNNHKVDLEVNAYNILKDTGIPIPKLIEYNRDKNYLIKEYIEGDLITDLVIKDELTENSIKQLFTISERMKHRSLNIDFYPDNFVLCDGKLYYIDFEVNKYDEKWDLNNWGIYYWVNSEGMRKYRETGDINQINDPKKPGVPQKTDQLEKVLDFL